MALYALDESGRVIHADEAHSFDSYRCIECRGVVQKRNFRQRRSHFYHLQTVQSCRLHSRSIDHLILQEHLRDLNPSLIAERPFKKILRIADLCWEEKNLVFEIQCSPIALSQAFQREKDYASEGYQIIWLMDDRLYNRRRTLRPTEDHLRHQGYYFSLTRPFVYDQFEVLDDRKRLARGPPLPVDLTRPGIHTMAKETLTRQLGQRQKGLFFAGDLLDRAIRYPNYLQQIRELEERILSSRANVAQHQVKKNLSIGLEFLLRQTSAE
ncbi:MAG: hypothetical protein HW387_640 [Parachlamydiales bacterium]|nr:hypothetical protein [Parachlamydiales bacterium]